MFEKNPYSIVHSFTDRNMYKPKEEVIFFADNMNQLYVTLYYCLGSRQRICKRSRSRR